MHHAVLMYHIPRLLGKSVPMCCKLKKEKGKKLPNLNSNKFLFNMVITLMISIIFSVFIQNLIICIDIVRGILEWVIKLTQKDSH